jgi:hypothetical protein
LEISLDAELEIAEATSRLSNEFLAFLGCDSIVDIKLARSGGVGNVGFVF